MSQLEAPTAFDIEPGSWRFDAELEVASNGDNAKTAPVRIVALSGDPVFHSKWGQDGKGGYVVLDLDGMDLEKPRLPIDYCHDVTEVIGFVNKFDVDSQFVASGALVPYSADPQDKATEVIYKSQNGIPYQASVFFADDFLIERLGDGDSAIVNDRMIVGPVDIVRQWTLRGIAICPYGVDGATSTQTTFSGNRKVRARIKKFSQETAMSTQSDVAEAPVSETAAVEAQAANNSAEVKTEATEATEKTVEAKTGEAAAATGSASAETSQATGSTQLSVKNEGERFLTAFGEKGGVWFAQGKSFDEARDLHARELSAANAKLAKENGELRTQLTASRGETTPVSFSNGDAAKPAGKKEHQGLTAGLGRFSSDLESKIAALNGGKGGQQNVSKK